MRLFVETMVLLGVVLLAAKVAGRLCRRLKLPAVFGEMLIGSLVGLAVLQLFDSGFFSRSTELQWRLKEIVNTLADFGVILLLFFAGVETEFDEIKRAGKAALLGAIGVVILSVAGGAGVSSYFGYDWSEAIFVGAVLAATGLAIGVAMLKQYGQLQSKVGDATLGGASLADALSLFTVLLVVAFSTSNSAVFAGQSKAVHILARLGKTVAFFGISWLLGWRFLKGLREQKEGVPVRRLLIGFILMAALLYTYAAMYLGSIVAVAWAYLAGVLFGQTRFKEELGHGARALMFSLFAPLLFISSIGRLSRDWLDFNPNFLLAILMIAIVGKVVGASLGAKLGGVSFRESWQVGAGVMPGGEVGLIFAAYGLSEQIISPSVFAVLVMAVLATSMLAPLLMWIYQRRESRVNQPAFITPLLVLCLSAGPFTVGIQAAQQNAPTPAGVTLSEGEQTGLPQEVRAMLDGLRKRVDREAELAELISRAESIYREGEALYKRGDRQTAEESFAKAREIILSSEEEVFYEPSVHAYFLQLTHQLAALKGTALPFTTGSQFPTDANERIRTFVKYHQGRGRNAVRSAFARLTQYETMMRKIFREEGVPEDLIYVGLVESAYNPYAQSPAGARGIWQFVRETGRRYGLRQMGLLDERHDPEKSTRAAARYLRDLYALFGDWPLALAAYNAGEYRVLQVIERTGIKDFWQISRRGLLPQETITYVPAALAAMVVGEQEFEQKPAMRATETKSVQTGARCCARGKTLLKWREYEKTRAIFN